MQLNPDELQAHPLLGAALTQLGHSQEAASAWNVALKIDPGSKAALDGQAKNLINRGDYASVIGNLRSAARDDNLALDLAIAYRETGMLDEVEQTLKQGLIADPGSDNADTCAVQPSTSCSRCARARDKSKAGRSGKAVLKDPLSAL